MSAVMIGRDCKHANAIPSEMPLVVFPGVGCEVRAHLALKTRLQEVTAHNRHGAAVDLHHEIPAGGVRKLQPEDKVGHEANLADRALLGDFYAHREWTAFAERLVRKRGDDLVGVNETHVIAAMRCD